MANTAKACVVVPNWDGKDMLAACLDSLLAQGHPAEVIVVDNGSVDGSVSFVKKNYPGVRLVELDKNYGFAGGVNAGIEAAMQNHDVEFVALLNNDAVVEPNWLEELLESAVKNPEAGIFASKIKRFGREELDSTGEGYSIWGMPYPRGRNEPDQGQYDDMLEVFGASGGASLYRTEMLDRIGLFDADFFAYFEDVDISFRAQLAGWKVRYVPSAVANHTVNATSSKHPDFSLYHSSKNFMLLYAKNMPTRLYIKYLPLFCLQFCRWFLTSALRGKLPSFLKGVFAAIRLHKSTMIERKVIQASRKVTDAYIDGLLYHHRPPKPPKLAA